MTWSRQTGSKGAAGRGWISLLLLGLFLAVLVLGSSFTLHKALHPNAGKADHHCAVTLLASGQVEASGVAAMAAPAPAISFCFILADVPVYTGVCFNISQGRGPPALLS